MNLVSLFSGYVQIDSGGKLVPQASSFVLSSVKPSRVNLDNLSGPVDDEANHRRVSQAALATEINRMFSFGMG